MALDVFPGSLSNIQTILLINLGLHSLPMSCEVSYSPMALITLTIILYVF